MGVFENLSRYVVAYGGHKGNVSLAVWNEDDSDHEHVADLPVDVALPVLEALQRVCGRFFHPGGTDTNRWLRRGPHEHVYCALGHIASYLRGKKDEDHLALASARLLLAIARETVE